jgi:hypothetical protein
MQALSKNLDDSKYHRWLLWNNNEHIKLIADIARITNRGFDCGDVVCGTLFNERKKAISWLVSSEERRPKR